MKLANTPGLVCGLHRDVETERFRARVHLVDLLDAIEEPRHPDSTRRLVERESRTLGTLRALSAPAEEDLDVGEADPCETRLISALGLRPDERRLPTEPREPGKTVVEVRHVEDGGHRTHRHAADLNATVAWAPDQWPIR